VRWRPTSLATGGYASLGRLAAALRRPPSCRNKQHSRFDERLLALAREIHVAFRAAWLGAWCS
jgi:hypothetical protein